jgi:histone H1/5
LNKVSA